MKRILLIPLMITTVLLVSFGHADDWLKFTSHEGHYSISFPGKPTEELQSDTTADKIPFVMHLVSYAPADTEVYMIGWIDMRKFYPTKSMKEILENSRDGAVASMNATDVKTIETNLDRDPYIEFTFSTSQFAGKDRIYVIDKCQFSIIALGYPSGGVTEKMDKFINSFKHTK